MANSIETALVVGVGAVEGLGARVARTFAVRGGLHVVVVGRTSATLAAAVADIEAHGGQASVYRGDVTDEADVLGAVKTAEDLGPLRAAIFNAGGNRPRATLESDTPFVEEMLRVNALAGFTFGREVIRSMQPYGRGTLVFTGASAKPGFAAFAAAKAALRATAQAMAREFGPQGIHVGHIVIDGAIAGDRLRTRWPALLEQKGEGGALELDAIAEAYWQLHQQHPSAWTHELDLRPFKEPW